MFKLRAYEFWDKLNLTVIGPFYRSLGKSLYALGAKMQGELYSDDRLVPSLRLASHGGHRPNLAQANFVAPNATILGNVSVGQNTSVWYNSNLRGDLGAITVGQNTLLQDLVSVISREAKNPTLIGNNVVVAPNVLLESCTVEDGSFVGMGSTVHQGAHVKSFAVVAAGAVIPEKTVVPPNQIWAGSPAKYLRDITPEEREALNEHHAELVQLAKIHAEECEKGFRQLLSEADQREENDLYEPEELMLKEMEKLGFPIEPEDEPEMAQKVWIEPRLREDMHDDYNYRKNYDPYEQDLFNFPDQFQIHGENFEKYERAKKYFEENPTGEAKLANKIGITPDPFPNKKN